MSQPHSSSSHLKRPNDGESRADRPKRQVTFKEVNTPVSGTSEDPISGTPDTLVSGTFEAPVSGTSEDPISGTSEAPVSGTSEAPVSGTSEAPVSGTSEAPVSGTPNTHSHEDPSHSSSSSPIIPTRFFPASLKGEGTEIFLTPLEGDTGCNMSKSATLQNTPRTNRGWARRAKPFIPKYSSPGPSHLELKNATILRDQSFYDLSDSKSDESSSDEDDDSDKENEDPEAPRPNKDFKESGTGSEEPLGSSSTYRRSSFMLEYERNRQELVNKLTHANGYNMPVDNRQPFPGPNMQPQQDSNGPLHDHVQEGSEDSEGSEDQHGYEKLMTDTMKAIHRQNVLWQSFSFSSREMFMDEGRDRDERELHRKEANSLDDKIFNNRILLPVFLSYLKGTSGDMKFHK